MIRYFLFLFASAIALAIPGPNPSLQNSALVLFVSKDLGNDTNNGSISRPYKTIGAAVTAANAVSAYYKQVNIHITPVNNGGSAGGNYNENITLSQQGVNLICDQPSPFTRGCVVGGTLTVNLTGTSGGTNFIAGSNEVYVVGLVFTSGSSDTVTFSGSTFQRLLAMNCYFQAGAAHSAVVTNTGLNGSTPSEFRSYDTVFENNSSSLETVTLTSARFWTYGTTPTVMNDNTSGTAVLQNGASSLIGQLTQYVGEVNVTSNTANATMTFSSINSGANPCIATPSSPSTGVISFLSSACTTTATNSMTGSGVLVPSGSAKVSTGGDIVSTITQGLLNGFPQGQTMIGAGATTASNDGLILKNYHLKSEQTTAPTTTLSGNAGTGGSPACTLTNATDSDGKLSLKTGTASWATGTQCTINFNLTWAVAPICVFSPSNAAAAVAMNSQQINFPDAGTGTQTISAGAAFTSQVTATWHYHCEETQ